MMMKVYVDTSVFGGCFDEEWMEWSNRLMEEFRSGRKLAVVSELTIAELERSPSEVRELFAALPEASKTHVLLDEEAKELADGYIAEGSFTRKMLSDARHIALATIHRVDVLVSWNFRHIVNLNRIRVFNAVNLKAGYPLIEIRSPREVLL